MVSDSSAPTAGRSAAAILAGAAAGSHLACAAADAWFLAAVGPGRLGLAVAGSSFLVALVVAAVGGLADRRDRQRTLVALAGGGALALAGGLFLLTGVVLLLGEVMPYWLASLLVGLVTAAAGAAAAFKGIRALQGLDAAPRQTIRTLKEDTAWAKAQLAR